jgi:hypothetical protein
MQTDLKPHFMTLSGSQYLKVAGRILWFREAHPNGSISSDLVQLDLDRGLAVFKAIVCDAQGVILATAYGSETQKGFPAGWIEKAETVAVGRALAQAGFGTAFAVADFHDHHDAKLADAPVQVQQPAKQTPVKTTQKATQDELKSMFALLTLHKRDTEWLKRKISDLGYPEKSADLDSNQVTYLKKLIAELDL